jgi:hypothetical protein
LGYQALRGSLCKTKADLDARPNQQNVREMKRFGVLPVGFDVKRNVCMFSPSTRTYWGEALTGRR